MIILPKVFYFINTSTIQIENVTFHKMNMSLKVTTWQSQMHIASINYLPILSIYQIAFYFVSLTKNFNMIKHKRHTTLYLIVMTNQRKNFKRYLHWLMEYSRWGILVKFWFVWRTRYEKWRERECGRDTGRNDICR